MLRDTVTSNLIVYNDIFYGGLCVIINSLTKFECLNCVLVFIGLDTRDVPINRHRQVSAILGGIGIGIGIGKILPILADSLNIITLLIFFRSDRFTSVFLTRQKHFSFYESVYTCYEKKNYKSLKKK